MARKSKKHRRHQGAGRNAVLSFMTCASALLAGPAFAAEAARADTPAVDDQAAQAAQSAPAPESTGMQEVVVTARRVSESIQRVPLAVTALSGEKLAQANIADLTQLTKVVPGVDLCCTVFNQATNTFVRGIAQGAPTYFADVPVASIGYGNLFDIGSVEILKGPQGTLFGQASNAGAFVYQPRKPGNEFGGTVSTVAGSYDRRTVEAAVDAPLVKDKVLVRLAAITSGRRGYVHDLSNNMDYGDENYSVVRGSLVWKISDKLENYTLLQHSRADTVGSSSGLWVLDDFNFNASQSSQNNALRALNGGTQAAYDALRAQLLARARKAGPYTIIGTSVGCASANGPVQGPATVTALDYPSRSCPHDYYVDDRAINTTTYNINGNWSLKNIYGYVRSKQYQGPFDVDGSPLILTDIRSPYQSAAFPIFRSWSDEIQLHGSAGLFDITAGAFYYRQKQDTGIVYADFNRSTSVSRTDSGAENRAIYGQADIHLDGVLPGLTGTVGLRGTQSLLEQTIYSYNFNTLALTRTVGGPNSPAGHAEFRNLAYTAGLKYQYSPRTMFFLANSRGFSAGGLQNVAGFETFKPSVLNNLEAGVKSSFSIGAIKARTNASVFYGKFNDVQVNIFQVVNNTAGVPVATTLTQNAAKANVSGAEGEFTLVPAEGLEVGGFAGYLHNVYTSFPSVNPTTLAPLDLSDTPFLLTPKWKIGLRASYRLPLPLTAGTVTLNLDATHQTEMVNTTLPRTPVNPANPMTGLVCKREHTVANGYPVELADGGTTYVDCVQAFSNVNVGVQWRQPMGAKDLTLQFQVSNLTRNRVTSSQANLRDAGVVAHMPAVPRMWTLRATYDF